MEVMEATAFGVILVIVVMLLRWMVGGLTARLDANDDRMASVEQAIHGVTLSNVALSQQLFAHDLSVGVKFEDRTDAERKKIEDLQRNMELIHEHLERLAKPDEPR